MNKLKKAIAAYEKQAQAIEQRLIDKIQPFVDAACKKWGFDFCAGMGTYTFYAAEGRPSRPCVKIDGQYFRVGDANSLIDLLEPDLIDALEHYVDGRPIGSLLDDVRIDKESFEWVLIKAGAWCLDEPVAAPTIALDFDPKEIDNGMTYFGWTTRQLAETVINEYVQDWDVGSRLLASLPLVDDAGVVAAA
jgi:hypothetical protein